MERARHIFAREATSLAPLLWSAGRSLLPIGALLAAGAWPIGGLGFGAALAIDAGVAALVLRGLGDHLPHRAFGAANVVTAARAAVTALLLGVWVAVAVGPLSLGPDLRWTLTGLAAGAWLCDGLDGYLARRGGVASRFGARFDMETDALFILALSLLVHAAGQAGAFVLLSGAMRYLFVAAMVLVPALRAPLPPRFWRKAICAVQAGVLVVALAPIVPAALAQGLCAAALALLVFSFATDCAALLAKGADDALY